MAPLLAAASIKIAGERRLPGRAVCQRRSRFQGAKTARFCLKAGNRQQIWEKHGFPKLHTASFFRFIAANFSLTQVVTRARPRCCVYRIACFSFASANTRSTLKRYNYLIKTLCGECAVQAIDDKEDGVYLELCENCGTRFDPFIDEMEFQRQTGDDGVEIDMFGKYLCLNCSLEKYENFDPDEV